MSDATTIPPCNDNDADEAGRNSALATIAELSLEAFVTDWNAGRQSLITDIEGLLIAASFEEALAGGLADRRARAWREGHGSSYDEHLRVQIEPHIWDTSEAAIVHIVDAWADKIITAGPAAFQAPAPWSDADDWAHWVVDHVEGPILCDPYGDHIVVPRRERGLLVQGLLFASAKAVHSGWLTRDFTSTGLPRLPAFRLGPAARGETTPPT